MIQQLERLSINAWPALEERKYDGWLIRASNGYSRRANSVSVVGASKTPLDERIQYCEKFYDNIGLPAIFKIIRDKSFEKLDEGLLKRGYGKIAPTSVRIKKLFENNFNDNANVETQTFPGEKWVDAYFDCAEKDIDLKSTYASILNKIKNKGIWATYKESGKAVGFGFSIIEKEYCGIYNLFVVEEFRGKGCAQAIMNKLLYESKSLGAEYSYLQVEEGNLPAETLYDKMGYKKAYQYFYRKLG